MSDFNRLYFWMIVVLILFLGFMVWTDACHADTIVLGSAPSTIITPGQLPTQTYTSPGGVTTIQPPGGLPTHIYPGPTQNSPTTVITPGQLPTHIYGR